MSCCCCCCDAELVDVCGLALALCTTSLYSRRMSIAGSLGGVWTSAGRVDRFHDSRREGVVEPIRREPQELRLIIECMSLTSSRCCCCCCGAGGVQARYRLAEEDLRDAATEALSGSTTEGEMSTTGLRLTPLPVPLKSIDNCRNCTRDAEEERNRR